MDYIEKIKKIKIIPVIALDDANDAVLLAKALISGGLQIAEVTFRTDAAADSIKAIKKECPEMLLIAGTVLTTAQVDEAINAGGDVIVAPGFNGKIVDYCKSKRVPIIPGVATASEIEQAIEHEINVVKFFPAEAMGGVKTIKALSGPYNKIKFMPTGGINLENMKDYLNLSQVISVGGSWMVSKELIKNKKFDEITKLTLEAVKSLD
ncbi:MAG: bifunctional 4-hydroxy-2-oxoglutarate aldolase/2-dehydro-3-deoxy-phosphogluconate aldolase [Lachnospiraceae bacterium]|jgi:2-dehydro-3-deoxyphosphogluconate aldolase/(4S)-4-hydroxy-2-oxoglutarate aldolase|nr:bifunctional 4-hydroxy-2-oxoglutarate aldolase/2-dehydro-3-deoxy-phosphogluconate aldolase [Lachnospiraceae bacterium]